jgi:hypothetical protein
MHEGYVKKHVLTDIPFWRIFLHISGRTPGRCGNSGSCRQSLIGTVELSNGSAHFGSESERHTQHLIQKPDKLK